MNYSEMVASKWNSNVNPSATTVPQPSVFSALSRSVESQKKSNLLADQILTRLRGEQPSEVSDNEKSPHEASIKDLALFLDGQGAELAEMLDRILSVLG